ncbi:MAG: hypothetical protein ACRBN8_44200 [Nannocystales bacterium]
MKFGDAFPSVVRLLGRQQAREFFVPRGVLHVVRRRWMLLKFCEATMSWMRRALIGLVVSSAVGCTSPAPAAPAGPPQAAKHSAVPEELETAPPQVRRDADPEDPAAPAAEAIAGPPDAEAGRAYVAAIEAYAAKDTAAYFGAFADPMTCFYGEPDYPRSTLEELRGPYFGSTNEGTGPLSTMAIHPVLISPDQVVLVHWGVHRDGIGKRHAYPRFQRKWVVMTSVDGAWKIGAEFSHGTSQCYDDDLRGVQPPRPGRGCIRSMGKCMLSCCKPGESPTKQCDSCERQCAASYEACLDKLE